MKKLIKVLVILVLIGVIVALATNIIVSLSAKKHFESNYDNLKKSEYDAIIVLGCGVYSDGTPSRMLCDRLNTAIELYNSGVCNKIIMSGDHGTDGYDEVNTMFDYAVDRGVSPDDIFLDHAGFSTYETMYRAMYIFELNSAIVVTQEYHLYRAVYDCRAMGIDAIGVAATSDPFPGQSLYSTREFLARIKDCFYCIVKPKPTFLGETVDINGDSSVTFDR